jgi:hypothetical protein
MLAFVPCHFSTLVVNPNIYWGDSVCVGITVREILGAPEARNGPRYAFVQ